MPFHGYCDICDEWSEKLRKCDCDAFVCENCYNYEKKMCKECVETESIDAKILDE